MKSTITVLVKGVIIIIVLLFLVVTVSAQQPVDSSYKNNTIVLPAIGSSPETSLLFGGVGIYQFRMGDPQAETRSSNVLVSSIYTLNQQLSVGFVPQLILEDEKWILEGMYAYSYFPETFWGIGPFTRESDEVNVASKQIFLQQSALKKIAPGLFAGPQLRWTQTYDLRFENADGDRISTPILIGAEDYSTIGIGAIIRWDTRNSIITPTKNHMISFTVMTHPSGLGTIENYTTYILDARKYHDYSGQGRSVLATQFITQLGSGHIPFKDMAMLGGEHILRGYFSGRFRDRHGAQLQTEYRQLIYGRIGVAFFAGAGQVWPSFDNMALEDTRFAGGGGLRFNLNKKDPTNIRLDVGFGRKTSGLYLTIGEAF